MSTMELYHGLSAAERPGEDSSHLLRKLSPLDLRSHSSKLAAKYSMVGFWSLFLSGFAILELFQNCLFQAILVQFCLSLSLSLSISLPPFFPPSFISLTLPPLFSFLPPSINHLPPALLLHIKYGLSKKPSWKTLMTTIPGIWKASITSVKPQTSDQATVLVRNII